MMKIGLIICLLLIAFMTGDGFPGNTMDREKERGFASDIQRNCSFYECPTVPCCNGDKCNTDSAGNHFCGN
nr:conotoxin precursor Rimp05 [Conus judaeus]